MEGKHDGKTEEVFTEKTICMSINGGMCLA